MNFSKHLILASTLLNLTTLVHAAPQAPAQKVISKSQEKQAILWVLTKELHYVLPDYGMVGSPMCEDCEENDDGCGTGTPKQEDRKPINMSPWHLKQLDIQSQWAMAKVKPTKKSGFQSITLLLNKQQHGWKVIAMGADSVLIGTERNFGMPKNMVKRWLYRAPMGF